MLNTPARVRQPDYGQHIPALALEQKLDFLLQQLTEHKNLVTVSIKKNTTELEQVKEDVQWPNKTIKKMMVND